MINSIDSKRKRTKLSPRREPYWHKLQKGGYVGFRVTPNGSKTWVARLRVGESQRFYSIGGLDTVPVDEQFDAAQKQAREWFSQAGTVKKAGYTIKEVIDDYLKHLEINKGKNSAYDAKTRLYKHVIPDLGKVQLSKLKIKQVNDWKNSLVRISDDEEDVRKSKDGANRLLNYFKAALNLAYKNRIITTNEGWATVEPFQDVGDARKVFLNESQINRLLKKTTGGFHKLIKSALLTGVRYGELAATKVEDFDPIHGTLRLQSRKGKGKLKVWDCYLSNDAITHFKMLAKDKLPTAHLHVKDDGTPWKRSHQHRPMQEAVKAAKLPKKTTLYALRHTYISRALKAGINIHVLAENVGTSVRMIEKHYAKWIKSDRQEMFDQVKMLS